jgi:3-dehydroquinate dehydratase II
MRVVIIFHREAIRLWFSGFLFSMLCPMAASQASPQPAQSKGHHSMNRILVMHGVNLNLFGKRDPKHYGTETLEDINGKLSALAGELGVEVSFFQSNYEGAFVERIQEAHGDGTAGIVLNAGAWTHYSYAIMDALAILSIPAVEVHMSNVHAREAFRHFSVLSAVTRGSIAGFGSGSYLLGLRAVVDLVKG